MHVKCIKALHARAHKDIHIHTSLIKGFPSDDDDDDAQQVSGAMDKVERETMEISLDQTSSAWVGHNYWS